MRLRRQQLTHVIRLDTQAPVVSNLTITGEGNERTLSFDVTKLLLYREVRILVDG